MNTTRRADVDPLAIPKQFRRPKELTGKKLLAYRKRQEAASKANRPSPETRWRGVTKAQRNHLRRFGWSDSQIKALTKFEVNYHIQNRNQPSVRFAMKAISEADKRIMEGKSDMTTKTKTKTKTEKSSKKTETKTPRKTGVGVLINNMLMSGKTDDEVRKEVLKQFGPDAKAVTKKNHVPWYRAKLKRDGKKIPEVKAG